MICCICNKIVPERGVRYCAACTKYLADPVQYKIGLLLRAQGVEVHLERKDDDGFQDIRKLNKLPRRTNMVKMYNTQVMAAWAGEEQVL